MNSFVSCSLEVEGQWKTISFVWVGMSTKGSLKVDGKIGGDLRGRSGGEEWESCGVVMEVEGEGEAMEASRGGHLLLVVGGGGRICG